LSSVIEINENVGSGCRDKRKS